MMLAKLKIKILTSVMMGRNMAIGTILRHCNDDDAVVTLHFIQVGSKLAVSVNKIKYK